MRIFTVGHSNRDTRSLIALLRENGVRHLADVRSLPRSRHNPQFNRDVLARDLAGAGIGYSHRRALGGMRKPRPDSVNQGWHEAGLRGYADYMRTPSFESAVAGLLEQARRECTAVMCAEADPLRCHRRLLADALTLHGVEVCHILAAEETRMHERTPFAEVAGGVLIYPFALV